MELIGHLGLSPQKDPTVASTIHKLCGFVVWYFLFNLLLLYQVISVISSILSYSFPETSINMKRKACIMFWDICIYFLNLNGVTFSITGDSITSESALFLCNHRSLVDHIALNYLARYSYFTNNDLEVPIVNFFTWFLIWKIPTIRILTNMAKNDENWELDSQLSETFFNGLINSKKTEWLVVFPEVNIFTTESSKLQKVLSEKFYLPVFKHLLYPRFSSFFNVITAIQGNESFKFNKLYDLTVFYYELSESGEKQYISPNLLKIFSNHERIFINIDVRFKNISRISSNRRKLEKWLEKTWSEKDQFLDQNYYYSS